MIKKVFVVVTGISLSLQAMDDSAKPAWFVNFETLLHQTQEEVKNNHQVLTLLQQEVAALVLRQDRLEESIKNFVNHRHGFSLGHAYIPGPQLDNHQMAWGCMALTSTPRKSDGTPIK